MIGLTVAVAAPGPKDAAPKKDPPVIVGEWRCVELLGGGRAVPAEMLPEIVFEFTADGKFRCREGAEERPEGTYTADPAKEPGEVDYAAGGIAKKNKGIYKVEKDTLTVCFTEGGGDRPTAFESPAGDRILLLTFKRVKKD